MRIMDGNVKRKIETEIQLEGRRGSCVSYCNDFQAISSSKDGGLKFEEKILRLMSRSRSSHNPKT